MGRAPLARGSVNDPAGVLGEIIKRVDDRLNASGWGDDPLGCREAYVALELIQALAYYLNTSLTKQEPLV